MDIQCKIDDTHLTIAVEGSLTFSDYKPWRSMFETALDAKPHQITLDLTQLVTFDSAALGLILIFQAKAINETIEFEVIQPKDGFMRHALKCADIQCVPSLACPPEGEGCSPWERVFGPLNVRG